MVITTLLLEFPPKNLCLNSPLMTTNLNLYRLLSLTHLWKTYVKSSFGSVLIFEEFELFELLESFTWYALRRSNDIIAVLAWQESISMSSSIIWVKNKSFQLYLQQRSPNNC